MKKIVLGLYIFSSAFVWSCKEIGPAVDLSPITAKDTTYIGIVEASTPRKVLVEECTGVKCVNCPDGAAVLKTIEEANPNNLIVIGIHTGFLTSPIDGASQYNFQSQAASDLMSFFSESPSKPAAAIDRIKEAGSYFMDKGIWQQKISNRFSVPTKENITITSSFDTTSRQAIIKVRVAYTSDVSDHQNLMVGLIENDIIDAQEFPSSIDTFYHHNHVLRSFLTPASGSAVLDSLTTKFAGRVYERTFIYTVNSAWNSSNCKIFAYLFKNESGQDYEVAQAAMIPLK